MEPQDIDNAELIDALRRHAAGDESAEGVFEVLRAATLLLPVAPEDENAPRDATTMVEPARSTTILENRRGELAVPAFTHEGALREWEPQGSAYVGMTAQDVFAMALDRKVAVVLINPGSPEGIQIGERGIEKLARA